MKKLITVLFLFSLILGNLFCQNSKPDRGNSTSTDNEPLFKNEGYLSLGTVSCVGLLGGLFFSIADEIADSISENDDDDEPFEMYSIGLGYNLFILDFLGLGGFLNFEKVGKLSLVSAQAKVSLQYGWRHFKFYHSVSGGVMFITDGAFCPVFDVTPLGLKLDFDDFNIFVEGALPTTALLKAGVSWYF